MPKGFGAIAIMLMFFTGAEAKVYNLDELLSESYASSRELKVIEEELQKADARVNEAMGTAFPTVSTSINYSHALSQYNPLGGGSSGGSISLLDTLGSMGISPMDTMGRGLYTVAGALDQIVNSLTAMMGEQKKNALALSLSVNQPIYAQGKVGVGLKIAKTYQSMLVCKFQDTRLKLRAKVISSYYAALIARKNLEVQKQNVAILEQSHGISVLRFNVGSGSELDTLSTRLYLESARSDLFKAESDLRLAYENLILQAGLPLKVQHFEVEGEIPDMPFDMTLEQALATLHRHSFALNQLRGSTELSDQMVNLAKTDFRPLVYAGATFSRIGQFSGFEDMNTGENWYNDQKLFVGMNWTLFSGLQRSQKLRQAEMDRSIAHLNQQQIIEELELAVKATYEQVMVNKNRLESVASVLALAQKGYDLSAKAYDVGQRTIIDMRNAELELSRAYTSYSAVQFAYLKAVVELKMLMGVL